MRQSSRWTSAVCEARMPCFLTLAPCSQPLVPGGMTKAAWPREPSSRSTEAITTWTSAMPPLVAQAFWPLRTHSSLASSYLAVVRIAGDVGAGVGLGGAEGGDLDVVGGAEALRHPLDQLLGRAGAEDAGDRQGGAEDRHADPGVAPEELLVDDREGEAGGVGPELGDALEAVEADLGGLLDDRPGELLLLVPLVRGGADDVSRRSRGPSRGCPSGPGRAPSRRGSRQTSMPSSVSDLALTSCGRRRSARLAVVLVRSWPWSLVSSGSTRSGGARNIGRSRSAGSRASGRPRS